MNRSQGDEAGTPSVERDPKPTPGPWIAERDGVYCDDRTGSIVASVGPFEYAPRPNGERGANARLIAAAPDLLGACRFVKNFLDGLESGLGEDDPLTAFRKKFHAPLHAKLDAAIAKAEPAALSEPSTVEARPDKQRAVEPACDQCGLTQTDIAIARTQMEYADIPDGETPICCEIADDAEVKPDAAR